MKIIIGPIYGISHAPSPRACVALASAILPDSQSPTLCALVLSGVPDVKNGKTLSLKLDNHNLDGTGPSRSPVSVGGRTGARRCAPEFAPWTTSRDCTVVHRREAVPAGECYLRWGRSPLSINSVSIFTSYSLPGDLCSTATVTGAETHAACRQASKVIQAGSELGLCRYVLLLPLRRNKDGNT